MTLLTEIQAKCNIELIDSRDFSTIATQINIGRRRANTREIGNGAILDVLGLDAGSALLDVINNEPVFRHVKPLVEQGRLAIGSPAVQATIQSFVPLLLTQDQADALIAIGYDDDPVTAEHIASSIDWSAL